MKKYPVLMYHRVESARCPVPGGDHEESRYAVSLADFEWQLDRMVGLGLSGVSMREVVERLDGDGVPEGWVGLTFDDGNESDYLHALPMLAERGFTATFFVCGKRVGAAGGLERGMIRAMSDAGMHIGAHGMTHRFLTTLEDNALEREVVESRDLLAQAAGTDVDHFAPPGGRYDTRALSALERAGYRAVSTSDVGYNPRDRRRFTFNRIPVTAATSRRRFQAIVTGDAVRLIPMFARARTLGTARRVLGESVYRRLRALGAGR